MDDKTKLVFKAYLALNSTEKEAFEKAVREYNSKGLLEQRNFSENFNKSLGPLMSARCIVCGK